MKYEITGETKVVNGVTLARIRALITIAGVVTSGDAGGWIESEKNLAQSGNAWVYGDAQVFGSAQVYGSAWVFGDAQVSGNAWVYGDAQVYGSAWVFGDAQVSGNAQVSGSAQVFGDAQVSGSAQVFGDAQVSGSAQVSGNAWVSQLDALCAFVGFGSQSRQTTAFLDTKIGVRIVCGCFTGTIDEFRAAVIKTHGEDSKHGKLYLGIANVIEFKFSDALGEGERHE